MAKNLYRFCLSFFFLLGFNPDYQGWRYYCKCWPKKNKQTNKQKHLHEYPYITFRTNDEYNWWSLNKQTNKIIIDYRSIWKWMNEWMNEKKEAVTCWICNIIILILSSFFLCLPFFLVIIKLSFSFFKKYFIFTGCYGHIQTNKHKQT